MHKRVQCKEEAEEERQRIVHFLGMTPSTSHSGCLETSLLQGDRDETSLSQDQLDKEEWKLEQGERTLVLEFQSPLSH